MRRIFKTVFTAWILTVILLLPAGSVSAATAPAAVASVEVTDTTNTTVSLSWPKVSGARGYYIYSVSSSGKLTQVAVTTKTKCVISGLKKKRTYQFQIYSYIKSSGKVVKSTEGSPVIKVTTGNVTPGAVKNFRVASRINLKCNLKWDAAENADGYIIYRYNSTKKKYVKIATTQDTLYQAKTPTAGKKYLFKIQSYRVYNGEIIYGELSSKIKAVGKSYSTSSVHSRYYNVVTNKSVSVTYADTGKKKTLAKGTSLVAYKWSNGYITASTKVSGTITCKMTNGREVKVPASALTYKSLKVTTAYYSNAVMEAWINSYDYTSTTDYLIWVNQYTMCTAVFKGSEGEWKLVRKCPCVIGKDGATPIRNYRICRYGYKYGGVIIYIAWFGEETGGYGFHRRVSSASRSAVSGGCIRLGDDDLNYIYKNCPMGTKVVSY